MAQTVKERIEERTAIADDQLRYQGFFGRIANRTGLAIANVTDNIISAGDTGTMAFLGGSILGIAQGATLGGIAGFVLFGMGMVPAMIAGMPAIFAIAAAGAAISGIHHGIQAVNYHRAHDEDKRIADRIAEKFGTVPERVKGHARMHAPKTPAPEASDTNPNPGPLDWQTRRVLDGRELREERQIERRENREINFEQREQRRSEASDAQKQQSR